MNKYPITNCPQLPLASSDCFLWPKSGLQDLLASSTEYGNILGTKSGVCEYQSDNRLNSWVLQSLTKWYEEYMKRCKTKRNPKPAIYMNACNRRYQALLLTLKSIETDHYFDVHFIFQIRSFQGNLYHQIKQIFWEKGWLYLEKIKWFIAII